METWYTCIEPNCMNHYCSLLLCLVAQSDLIPCDPMDCSSPGFSGHRTSQAGILEWVAISSSRGSYRPRDWTRVSCIGGGFFTTMKAHESLLCISNGAMKILSLLFCFMFVGCFSIFHLNTCWAFLWPHLVTSHFAPLQRPSSFYSGLQAWLQLIFRVHVCVTCLDSTALSYIFQLWASLGAVMTISVYCLLILWLLVLFAHKFMSPWRGQAVSFCEEPGTDLWLWKFVEWMFRPCWIDWKMFEIVTESLLLERVKWGWSVWSWFWPDPWVCTMLMSPWCEGWFILICVHSIERGHLHRALNSCLVCWCFL